MGTVGVQDHIIHGHASNFCGSTCDNEDDAVKLLRPVVMPLPAKRLCAWLGIEYGVPRITSG